jgi:hypothetical protein
MADAKSLRLIARASEDVPPISAALQDAVGQIGDFLYEPKARRFTLALNRFRWESGAKARGERLRTAVQVGAVLSAQSHRLKQGADEAVVSLLAVSFEPGEAPGGALVFTFSGGGVLRLDVECVDLALADVSEPWRASARPEHPDEPEAGA